MDSIHTSDHYILFENGTCWITLKGCKKKNTIQCRNFYSTLYTDTKVSMDIEHTKANEREDYELEFLWNYYRRFLNTKPPEIEDDKVIVHFTARCARNGVKPRPELLHHDSYEMLFISSARQIVFVRLCKEKLHLDDRQTLRLILYYNKITINELAQLPKIN